MRAPSVVILGLGRAAGVACARRYSDAGWAVTIVDSSQKNLDRAEDDLGDLANYLHEDQSTKLGLKNALSGTLEQFEGVDAVIHIPPVPDAVPLQEMDLSQFAQDFEKSAMTSLMAGKIFGSEMIREIREHELNTERPPYPKSLLQILGISAIRCDVGSVGPSIAQGSMLPVMKALAVEYAPYGIRSNAIVAIRSRSEEIEPWLKERTPLGRAVRSREIADTAFFSTSAEAGFITAHSFVLDGGRSALNGLSVEPEPKSED